MPREKLVAKGIDRLTTDKPQEDFWDILTPGLCLRISGRPGGRKTWYVRYRVGGKQRRQKLGTYPRVSLAEARERARSNLSRAEDGADPAQELHQRRSKDASFAAMASEVLAERARKGRGGRPTSASTQRERQRLLDVELLPWWGTLPAGAVSRRDVALLVETIERRGSPIVANRVLALVRLLYNGGLRRGFPGVEHNPAHLAEPFPEPRRSRFLEREELKVVWGALEPERLIPGAIFRLALLTAQRIGSVCAMRWADVDTARVWRIPAEVFKGRRPHLVPLSVEALAELDTLRPISGKDEYIFPGRGDSEHSHITNTQNALARIRERSKVPDWTAHDFRRTFRTHATRAVKAEHHGDSKGLGIAPHIADAVLGHKEASLGFDRYQGEPERYLLAEKRDALERWGRFVLEVVQEAP